MIKIPVYSLVRDALVNPTIVKYQPLYYFRFEFAQVKPPAGSVPYVKLPHSSRTMPFYVAGTPQGKQEI